MNIIKFEDLPISDEIKRSVAELGFEEPSPIQAQSIPVILTGKDVIGQAQTGTGKTAAFSIPVLDMVDPNKKSVQAVVLCPTRELAIQVSSEMRKLGKYKSGIKTLPVYGGQPIDRQIKSLKSGVQVVIGTPGRVIDHINRRTLKMDDVKMLVLDEADEMLNMGFIDQVRDIINKLNKKRETMLFSATIPEEILGLCKMYMNNPINIEIKAQKLITDNITHELYKFEEFYKLDNLNKLLINEVPETSVIFCKTKENVDKVFENLNKKGYSVSKIHGGMLQKDRIEVMEKFKRGNFKMLVSTDVAARGIDVEGITHVINYDLPVEKEAYVHRIGRTGRAGSRGKAISFVNQYEDRLLDMIEEYIGFEITVENEIFELSKDKRNEAIQFLKSKPKVKKEKSVALIADELEEEESDIKPVYDAVIMSAPEYNVDDIIKKLKG